MERSKGALKHCNTCGEDISRDLRRCPYCGTNIEQDQVCEDFIQQKPQAATGDHIADDRDHEAIIASNKNDEAGKAEVSDKVLPYMPDTGYMRRNVISNGKKVLAVALCSVVPLLGQLAGVIISLLFINTEEDEDRKSFGGALLIASLVVLAFWAALGFLLAVAFSVLIEGYGG